MSSAPLTPSSADKPKSDYGGPAKSGDPVKCDLCNVWCQGVVSYQSHVQGRPHYAKLVKMDQMDKPSNGNAETPPKGKKRPSGTTIDMLKCDVCDIYCQGKDQYEVHVQGIRHAKKAKMTTVVDLDVSALPFIKELTDGKKGYECTVCNVEMSGKSAVASHIEGSKHQRRAENPNLAVTPSKSQNKKTPTGEPLECKVCKLPVNSLFQLEEHRRSLKHRHKEDAYKKWALQEANIGKDYDAWDPSG